MPENNVESFAQTSDGFLWLGTTGGLVRFDGNHFDTFDHSNTSALEESSVTSLLSRGENLWMGTDGGCLLQRHAGVTSHIPLPILPNTCRVRSMIVTAAGRIKLTADEGTISWKDRDGQVLDLRRETEEIEQIPLLKRERGESDARTKTQRRDTFPLASVMAPDGSEWIGAEGGLFHRFAGESTFRRVKSFSFPVSTLMLAADGALWVGTLRDGLYVVRHGRINRVEELYAYRADSIRALFEDSSHSIWIGTQAGAFQLIQSSIQVIPIPGQTTSESSTLYVDSDGSLLVAARHLYRLKNNVLHPVNLPGLAATTIRNIVRDHEGNLWIGTARDGVYRLDGHAGAHFNTQNGLAGDSIRVMSVAHDGGIWVGTDDGLSKIHNGAIKSFRPQDGLTDRTVEAVVEDAHGGLWVGTSRGLNYLLGDHFQTNELVRRLAHVKVWSIYPGPTEAVWVGTRSDGLYCWNRGSVLHFTTREGLASNSIYKVIGTPADNLWLSGPGGVSRLSQKELLANAASGKEIAPVFFYVSDGKETPNFFGGMQASGVIEASGDVWFPTDHGPVHIPLKADASQPLRLYVRSVSVSGKEVPWLPKVSLSPDDSTLQVQYSPILLLPQTGVRFRYKLEGFDAQWNHAQRHSTVFYTNLPAGTFRFRVQAYDTRYPDSFAEATLVVVKQPHIYRRWWFLATCAVLLVVLLWALQRLRLRNAERRLQAVFAERMRLAREMHDTVLQGCAGVSTLLEASGSMPAENVQRDLLLEHAREQISSTMEDARRAILELRDAGTEQRDVDTALGETVARMENEFHRGLEFSFTGGPLLLPAGVVREMEMVAREAIYNALVHSRGTHIVVRATVHKKHFEVQVQDDGKGLDPEDPNKAGHYGIIGMRERIAALRGTFHMQPAEGGGTVVHFRVPVKSGNQ